MHPEADLPPAVVPTTRRAVRALRDMTDAPAGGGSTPAHPLGTPAPDAGPRAAVSFEGGRSPASSLPAADRPGAEVPTSPRRAVVRMGLAAAATVALAATGTMLGLRAGSGHAGASAMPGTTRPPRGTTAPPVGAPASTPTPTTPGPTESATPQPAPSASEEAPPPGAGSKDRDDSYTTSVPDAPSPPPVDPPLPRPIQINPADPLPLPVADTAEARAHVLRRAGIAVGEDALIEVERMGLAHWLADQLDPTVADEIEPVLREWYPAAYFSIAEARASLADYDDPVAARATEQAALARRLFGSRQVFEQVVDVFANTLNVPPMYGDSLTWSVADYHRTVIRAHALGRYADMLHAAARHPAMMVVLDNRRSTAADVNENYGRELLELHTVGYGAYTEADVRSSSMIMSGRRIADQEFRWESEHHALGPVSVLDFADQNTDAAAGLDLGDRYIAYLARHPRTAETIARKLAVRFVADKPSDDLVRALADVYLAHDTDIRAVMVALVCSDEFWSSVATKLRRPTDDLAGVIRCIGMTIDRTTADEIRHMFWTVDGLGDAPLRWGPPNGYPDVAEAWLGAGQVAGRWDHHRELVNGDRLTFAPSAGFHARITPAPGQTAGAWADQVSRIVLGAAADDRDRAAVLAFLGLPSEAVVEPRHINQKASVAALFFDSPRYLLC